MNLPTIKKNLDIALLKDDVNYYIHTFKHFIVDKVNGINAMKFNCDRTILYCVDGDNLIIKSNIPLFHTNDKMLIRIDKQGNVYAGIEYIVYNINNKIKVIMMNDEPTKMITI